MYMGKYWWCEVNLGWKNAKLPPKARYCYGHNDGTKAAVILISFTNLLGVVPIFSIYCYFNFMYIWGNIGGVKSILVKKTLIYSQEQGIVMHITLIPKLM